MERCQAGIDRLQNGLARPVTFSRRGRSGTMLIATFSLPHDAVALEQSFQELPGLEVEAERIVAHSRAWGMSGLWTANAAFESIDEVLAADPSVNEIIDDYEFADEKYYLLDWTNDVDERIGIYIDQRTSILDAEADADSWQIRIRFFSRDQFDVFRHTLDEEGIGSSCGT